MLKIENIRHIVLNGKAATQFSVYELRGDAWVFDYNASVQGTWKRPKTIATKHCAENGRLINLNDWYF